LGGGFKKSICESIETFEKFMYDTFQSDFLRRRKEWFQTFGNAQTAKWWVLVGSLPTLEDAVDKFDYLQKNGVSKNGFDLRNNFQPPVQ
jgi:hypothetical protein